MDTSSPPEYEAPPVWSEADAPPPSAPVQPDPNTAPSYPADGVAASTAQPVVQQPQVVMVQQPVQQAQPTQVVYVDQYGNPVQLQNPPQQQIVYQPSPGAQMVVQQPVTQGVELQVAGQMMTQTGQLGQTPNVGGGTIVGGYWTPSTPYNPNAPPPAYAPPDENHNWVAEDEVPPDYATTLENQNKASGESAGCCKTTHYKAWFFTFWIVFFLVSFPLCDPDSMCRCDSWSRYYDYDDIDSCSGYYLQCDFPCDMTWKLGAWFWVIFGVAYLLYLSEAFCCSSSHKYLKNINDGEGIFEYIERLKKVPPVIWWKVECYHYEHYTDSDGNSKKRKKTTHTARANYQYTNWRDTSMSTEGLDEYNLTKFRSVKAFTFGNSETENHYNWQAESFRRNNDRDTYQDFTYGVEVDGFISKMLVENQPGSRGQCLSDTCFYVWTFLGCTVCFRMFFASKAGRKEYLFQKEITI